MKESIIYNLENQEKLNLKEIVQVRSFLAAKFLSPNYDFIAINFYYDRFVNSNSWMKLARTL